MIKPRLIIVVALVALVLAGGFAGRRFLTNRTIARKPIAAKQIEDTPLIVAKNLAVEPPPAAVARSVPVEPPPAKAAAIPAAAAAQIPSPEVLVKEDPNVRRADIAEKSLALVRADLEVAQTSLREQAERAQADIAARDKQANSTIESLQAQLSKANEAVKQASAATEEYEKNLAGARRRTFVLNP